MKNEARFFQRGEACRRRLRASFLLQKFALINELVSAPNRFTSTLDQSLAVVSNSSNLLDATSIATHCDFCARQIHLGALRDLGLLSYLLDGRQWSTSAAHTTFLHGWWRLKIFTARCYASAVLAMALCLSVCLSVCPSQVGVLLKRLNVGSHKQHTIVQGL